MTDEQPGKDPAGSSTESTSTRVLEAWVKLEKTLRDALPVCSIQPPRQPTELLSALRINHRIDQEDESRVLALREIRNQVAHAPEEPSLNEVERYEDEVRALQSRILGTKEDRC